jgi:hypothetical protein
VEHIDLEEEAEKTKDAREREKRIPPPPPLPVGSRPSVQYDAYPSDDASRKQHPGQPHRSTWGLGESYNPHHRPGYWPGAHEGAVEIEAGSRCLCGSLDNIVTTLHGYPLCEECRVAFLHSVEARERLRSLVVERGTDKRLQQQLRETEEALSILTTELLEAKDIIYDQELELEQERERVKALQKDCDEAMEMLEVEEARSKALASDLLDQEEIIEGLVEEVANWVSIHEQED